MMDAASWGRLRDVVAEAVLRHPAEREAFVRSHFPDPEECTTVLSLLADAEATAPQSESATDDGPAAIGPGTAIGPYVVVDRIGRGGMGEVFLGSDPRLRRRVALKCLTGSVPHDLRREQILNEARAAAAITHPNVAAIYDVIEKDDRMFIVMEYVQGETLAARLRREPLPIETAVAFGRQLASALAAAHRQGVVHRDLKPANVQLTPQGTVKVLDFGIANAAHSLTTAGTHSTTIALPPAATPARSSQPGTPPYMSPEQLLNHRVDERSDIFSLGVVLFEMATGRRPFPGSTIASIALAVADGAPRADAVERRVPSALADVIARALHLDPALRFQTAAEFGDALEQVTSILAPPRRGWIEWTRLAALGAAIGLPIAILILAAIGFIATIGFNTTFGRDGTNARFGSEPWPAYLIWGARAMFPSLVIMTMTAIAAMAVRFVLSLFGAFRPIAARFGIVRQRLRAAVASAGLDHPATLAQALCVLGVVTIAALLMLHVDLITAWTALFNTSPIERLWPMRESTRERLYYHVELDVATLALTAGVIKVLQLRRARGSHEGTGAIAMLAGVIVVMVLLNEWPYRTFSHRDFERVEYAAARCYITGQSGDELLVLCPSSPPPRNRVVARNDPALRRTGIIENVFRGIDPPPGAR
jgi:hypothetical protein